MLKRLAAAGILTAAAGGVMMSATPAMAGGDYDKDFYSNHHNILSNKCEFEIGNEKSLIDVDALEFGNTLSGILGFANTGHKAGDCEQSNAIVNKNH